MLINVGEKKGSKVIATVIPLKVDDGGKLLIYTTCI